MEGLLVPVQLAGCQAGQGGLAGAGLAGRRLQCWWLCSLLCLLVQIRVWQGTAGVLQAHRTRLMHPSHVHAERTGFEIAAHPPSCRDRLLDHTQHRRSAAPRRCNGRPRG